MKESKEVGMKINSKLKQDSSPMRVAFDLYSFSN
jgi:hypothetical protein